MPKPHLWDFACRCYAEPPVAELCLKAQDQGMDVCLLLCALWLDQRAVGWTPVRGEQLGAQAADWQQRVVAPLRQLRQAWKPAAAGDPALRALRTRLQELELAAEQQLLERLEETCARWPAGPDAQPWLPAVLQERLAASERARLQEAARAAYSEG